MHQITWKNSQKILRKSKEWLKRVYFRREGTHGNALVSYVENRKIRCFLADGGVIKRVNERSK